MIYLDPISQRRAAPLKKDLSVLQALHSATDNEDSQLFEWAMAQPARRVVVKRPSKAPPLQQRQPSHAIMVRRSGSMFMRDRSTVDSRH